MEQPRKPQTTNLSIRNIDVQLRDRLRIRAALNGRSMESEIRSILSAAVSVAPTDGGLGSRIRQRVDEFYRQGEASHTLERITDVGLRDPFAE